MKPNFNKLLILSIVLFTTSTMNAQTWNLTGNAGTTPGTNFLGTSDAKALYLKTNNSNRLVITSAGKVGIGTASPVNKLTVNGSANFNGNVGIGTNTPTHLLDVNGVAVFGSVGIGVATPTHLLEVSGDAAFAGVLVGRGSGGVLENTAIGNGALHSNQAFGGYNTANGYRALYLNNDGASNTAVGSRALYYNIGGSQNTAVGADALFFSISGPNTAIGYVALQINTTGHSNVACGDYALSRNTIGHYNSAMGSGALGLNSTGNNNTAIGIYALANVTTANDNTAIGSEALFFNTGAMNTASGRKALYSNTYGTQNVATGTGSLVTNTTGSYNTANGTYALFGNISGSNNTSVGTSSLANLTSGNYNTAIGSLCLQNNQTSQDNTAVGYQALYSNTGPYNTAVGFQSLYNNTTGYNNTGVGINSDVSTGGLIEAAAFGIGAVVNSNFKIRLGSGSVSVVESAAGSWTTSDGRFKNNVTEDVKGLEFIKSLRPVVYNFDVKKYEEFVMQNYSDSMRESRIAAMSEGIAKATSIRQTGFIAQEVEQAIKKCNYTFNGIHTPENPTDNYSLSYEKFVVPLVKSVQELSSENDKLKEEINQLKEAVYGNSNMNNGTAKIAVNDASDVPLLGQNIPNPTENNTIIPFRIPKNCNSASIVITELASGKVVKAIPVNCKETHLSFDAGTLASGSYTYSLYIDGKIVDTKQMVIAK